MSPAFTPWTSLAGGVLIGLAASLLWMLNGRIAGISGIAGGVISPRSGDVAWRIAFLVGLAAGGLALALLFPAVIGASPAALTVVAAAGLLVGIGTRLGGGCTSGHGVCGISRLSKRSVVATIIFMALGFVTVGALRAMTGSP